MIIKMVALLFIGLMIPLVAAQTVKIYPTEDVYTDDSSLSSNFNTEYLRVGNDVNFGRHKTYLQFDISSIGGEISEATLSLDPSAPVGVPNLQLHHVSSDGWNENSVTWNTAPTAGDLLGSQLVDGPDRIEFDVTESVLGESDGVLSLALTSLQESTENIYVQFFSGDYEAGGNDGSVTYWPYLEVTFDGAACNTEADTNCNGCVSQSEITAYAFGWLNGNPEITQGQVTIAAYNWLNGVNSC